MGGKRLADSHGSVGESIGKKMRKNIGKREDPWRRRWVGSGSHGRG